ncbi:GIY-YIG nuclease family protein [Leucobacter sp. CSA2]|uniref:GIY-YIG nuclease family protein n=1 Tax=Leucobacter edaphi TaxID=2796472 RepID=A0A934Q9W0_9MICO|nr:GIY-YIG nuclease family protein [Leucobacter edaphi]MBK0420596.1 GIY-YIG nuclease family protein [Leucobacter edaphi]
MNDKPLNVDIVSFDNLQAIFDTEDALLNAPEKPKKITSTDRLERSFVEILEFVREHGREPSATTREIAERKLGARLEGIRGNPEKVELLRDLDELGLLDEPEAPASLEDLLSLDSIGDGLGLLDDPSGLHDVAALPVDRRTHSETGQGAQREKCEDFDQFEPLFKQKHAELAEGAARLIPFRGGQTIREGAFFVLNGMMMFVAEVREPEYKKTTVRENRRERLRLIFENGTESAMYRQSLNIRFGEGDGGYEVVPVSYEELLADDVATGWVYVLRSLSDDPQISMRKNLYKIGFSTTPVEKRIANAKNEPTYLMAPVEIVETYRTYNMKTSALEHLLHRVFAGARLRINQTGTDGRSYNVTEWFEVPLHVIRQAIELITNGEIVDYSYATDLRSLVPTMS